MLRRRSACACSATPRGMPANSGWAPHSRDERLDPDRLDAVGERVVVAPARRALGGVGEPRAGADEDERVEPRAERERGVERDAGRPSSSPPARSAPA